MNEVETILLRRATDHLFPLAQKLREAGWRTEVIVFAPEEIERIPGYKVALVVPLASPEENLASIIDKVEREADRGLKLLEEEQ
jgi:hypothetical protein